MDMEQLKLILETFTTLGMEGKEAFIWYLVLHSVPSLLWFVFGMFVVWAVYKLILSQTNEWKLQQIRDLLGVGCRGIYTSAEHDAVIQTITHLRSKQ